MSLPYWHFAHNFRVLKHALGYAFLLAEQQPSEEELRTISMEILNSLMEEHTDDKVTNTVDVF